MKKYYSFLVILWVSILNAQEHKLEKLWETDSVIAVPESVLPVKNILYVSLVDGGGWDADGKGGVAKLSPDGKIIDAAWVTGMNAPKGLGIAGNRLYAADISEVIVINVQNGKIEKKIAIDSAKGLNDITVTDKGNVYVSDSRTAEIWRIENDVPSLYMDSVRGVNGLNAIDNQLYIGSGKLFLKADEKKQLTKIAEVAQGIDGIEPIGNGDFILTAWGGYIWYEKRILYVPTFNAKTVTAYSLK